MFTTGCDVKIYVEVMTVSEKLEIIADSFAERHRASDFYGQTGLRNNFHAG